MSQAKTPAGDEPGSPSDDELKPDAHVERMRGDPERPDEQRIRLIGFLGRDTEAGFWRVYSTASLDTYVRVAESDIVTHHRDEDPATQLGRTVLYIRQDATLQEVRDVRRQMQAEFLQGDITRGLSSGTFADAANRFGRLQAFSTPWCASATVSIIITSIITATPDPAPTSAEAGRTCFLCTLRGADC